MIRPVCREDITSIVEIWNGCAARGEVLFAPMAPDSFSRKFLEGEGRNPELFLVCEEAGKIKGFVHGVAPDSFRGAQKGHAYLTCLMVSPDIRGQHAGKWLLQAMETEMRRRGAEQLDISSLNPVNLSWIIPGSPGHDHNNAPGLDLACSGAGFFFHSGFENRVTEIAMYQDLSRYHMDPAVLSRQADLRAQGILTGPYDASMDCGFDRMCDRVGSDYWRDVLRTETEAWKAGQPNADARMWADGIRPAGPRTILAAVHDGEIVGFTGPVDLQKSGRGWFTGICTDPEYEGRGIATVLFNLLMSAFVEEGARFTTLFTGRDGHARKIYQRAGLRPVREFGHMTKRL